MTKKEEKYMNDARDALYKADAITALISRQMLTNPPPYEENGVDSISLIDSIYDYIEQAINALSDLELYGDDDIHSNPKEREQAL